jgi:hypothetical protein
MCHYVALTHRRKIPPPSHRRLGARLAPFEALHSAITVSLERDCLHAKLGTLFADQLVRFLSRRPLGSVRLD